MAINNNKNSKDIQELKSVFSRESSDQLKTQDKLTGYIRVTTPRTWIIAAALVLILASLTAWGFIGRIPRYIETTGVGVDTSLYYVVNGETNNDVEVDGIFCLVDCDRYTARQLDEKDARIEFSDGIAVEGKTNLIDTARLSQNEIRDILNSLGVENDWIVDTLNVQQGKYHYMVRIILDRELDFHYWGEVADVHIVFSDDAPITYLFR